MTVLSFRFFPLMMMKLRVRLAGIQIFLETFRIQCMPCDVPIWYNFSLIRVEIHVVSEIYRLNKKK